MRFTIALIVTGVTTFSVGVLMGAVAFSVAIDIDSRSSNPVSRYARIIKN
jgi:hypothetical protein